MPARQIDGHSIFYEERGSGHPLVLISGLGGTHFLWWKQIEPLSARYRVIALDNRGIGDSSPVSAPFTVADMAGDVAGLIHALDLGPSHIMGISMGGFIALTLALRHPERVRNLILVSTSAGGPSHVQPPPEMIKLLTQPESPDIATQIRAVYTATAASGFMQSNPLDLERLVQNALDKPLSLETYLYQFKAANDYTTRSGADHLLDHVTVPTMVVHGDIDPLVPYANGRYLAAHIEGARLETYEGVGHLPPIEAGDRLNNDVIAFLD
jgi:3-oxoadipate enol-lactonase